MAKILVIDDTESIAYTAHSFLSDEGHEVLTASTYDEALKHMAGADCDLVFCDIILGGRTGIDVLREVKARGLTCPVVMITGFPDVRTASEAVRLGAFDYVIKPVVQETLVRLARVALQYKSALDERERYRSHLEAIFTSVADGIVTVDKDMRVLELNEAARTLCGLGREAIGEGLAELPVPRREVFLETLGETLDTMQSVRARRFECPREGRPSLVLSVSTYPLLSRQSGFVGAVMVVRDETRVAALERDLNERRQFHGMVGKSQAMQNVYSLIESLADVETTVLITGESGAGKELVAEAIHYQGPRSSGPLVKVNCSALPENLLESELFGHVKGAFTGAASDRIGRFQRAAGGTILLDEIGDVSHRMQVSLLRVLEAKEFERVGDSRPTRMDVRVLASTNKNLWEMIERGTFREDLYYRLKVVEVALPPLRSRCEDIPLLADHLITKLNSKLNRQVTGLSVEVRGRFMEYPWPGNVRELEHALEHAMLLCRHEDTLCMHHLPSQFWEVARSSLPGPLVENGIDGQAIQQILGKTGWNKAKAARLLGVDRKTLYRKIAKYGVLQETFE